MQRNFICNVYLKGTTSESCFCFPTYGFWNVWLILSVSPIYFRLVETNGFNCGKNTRKIHRMHPNGNRTTCLWRSNCSMHLVSLLYFRFVESWKKNALTCTFSNTFGRFVKYLWKNLEATSNGNFRNNKWWSIQKYSELVYETLRY